MRRKPMALPWPLEAAAQLSSSPFGPATCREKTTARMTSDASHRIRGRRSGAGVSQIRATQRRRLHLTETDRRLLMSWIRAHTTPQRVARRARIVLLAAEGRSTRGVAARLGVSTRSVTLWKQRFEAGGPPALLRDAPGRGRKASVTVDAREQLRALLAMPPPAGRWTVRALAAATGISPASVHRALKADKLNVRGR